MAATQQIVKIVLTVKAETAQEAAKLVQRRTQAVLAAWFNEDSVRTWSEGEGAPDGSLLHWGFEPFIEREDA